MFNQTSNEVTLPDWPVWTRGLMLSGDAAEREDSSDMRVKGQSPLIQPSGAQSPLNQPLGKQTPPIQPYGALSPSNQPQGSGRNDLPCLSSGPYAWLPGHHPGTVRILHPKTGKAPKKGKAASVITMSSKEETTFMAQTTTLKEGVISSESASVETTQQNLSCKTSSPVARKQVRHRKE